MKNISYNDMGDLLSKAEIKELYEVNLKIVQSEFASYEQVKRFTLLSDPFTMESGELTNTLKIRRSIINERYKEQIDAMYN